MRLEELTINSLRPATRALIESRVPDIERLMAPELEAMVLDLSRYDGARGLLLRRAFKKAESGWEKYFWWALARHWVRSNLELEDAILLADEELEAFCQGSGGRSPSRECSMRSRAPTTVSGAVTIS